MYYKKDFGLGDLSNKQGYREGSTGCFSKTEIAWSSTLCIVYNLDNLGVTISQWLNQTISICMGK